MIPGLAEIREVYRCVRRTITELLMTPVPPESETVDWTRLSEHRPPALLGWAKERPDGWVYRCPRCPVADGWWQWEAFYEGELATQGPPAHGHEPRCQSCHSIIGGWEA